MSTIQQTPAQGPSVTQELLPEIQRTRAGVFEYALSALIDGLRCPLVEYDRFVTGIHLRCALPNLQFCLIKIHVDHSADSRARSQRHSGTASGNPTHACGRIRVRVICLDRWTPLPTRRIRPLCNGHSSALRTAESAILPDQNSCRPFSRLPRKVPASLRNCFRKSNARVRAYSSTRYLP